MYRAYFTSLESDFAKELKKQFEAHDFEVVTVLTPEIEFFVDTTAGAVPEDDKAIGENISPEAGTAAYEKFVAEPLTKLQKVLQYMTGRKRICFLSSRESSINESTATAGFGKNMAKAALHNILTITKNGMIEQGFTFRLYDPMEGKYPAEKAAASAFVYFTRDRYFDNDNNKDREDERNLILRDALGREIPW